MPFLALVGNPPRLANPIRFTGPSITFMPFNPFQKLSVDLFGASYQPGGAQVRNPYHERNEGVWEVPRHLWPEVMDEQSFDHWFYQSAGMHPAAIPSRFGPPHAGDWKARFHGANTNRMARGLPMLTREEWRRWVLLDVLDQLEGEGYEIGPDPSRSSMESAMAREPWYQGLKEAEAEGWKDSYRTQYAYGVEPRRPTFPGEAMARVLAERARRESAAQKSMDEFRRKRGQVGLFAGIDFSSHQEQDKDREAVESLKAQAERELAAQERLDREKRTAAIRKDIERRQAAKSGSKPTREDLEKAVAYIQGLRILFGDLEDLAAELGVPHKHVHDVFNRRVMPSKVLSSNLERLAAARNVRIAKNPGKGGKLPRQRNRDHRWKEKPEEEEISLEEAKKLPGFKKALKVYRRFHKTDPVSAKVIRVPDGQRETTLAGGVVHVFLGEREQTPYVVPIDASSKAGVRWYHDHPEDGRPMILLNPETGIVSDVGGNYLVDDWFYS